MEDRYGIPENFFGIESDEVWPAIGRITALASLLEDMIFRLLGSVSFEVMSKYEGLPAVRLVDLCEAESKKHASPELQVQIATSLAEVKFLRGERHALVHSLWTGSGWGWRPKLRHKVSEEPPAIIGYTTSVSALGSLITRFVAEIKNIDALQQLGHNEKARRLMDHPTYGSPSAG
jgi:hypothetical protein